MVDVSGLAVWGSSCAVIGAFLTAAWVVFARSRPITRVRLTGRVLAPAQPLVPPWQNAATFASINRDHGRLYASYPLASVRFDGTTLSIRLRAQALMGASAAQPLEFTAAQEAVLFPSRSGFARSRSISVSKRGVLLAKFGVREQAAFLTMMQAHGFRVDWVERKGLETRRAV